MAKYCWKININEHILPISSIYWQIQCDTKKLKTSIFWKPYVRFPSNKNYNDLCTSNMINLFKWFYSQILFSWNIVSNLLKWELLSLLVLLVLHVLYGIIMAAFYHGRGNVKAHSSIFSFVAATFSSKYWVEAEGFMIKFPAHKNELFLSSRSFCACVRSCD